jgi:hypothetical protein
MHDGFFIIVYSIFFAFMFIKLQFLYYNLLEGLKAKTQFGNNEIKQQN